MISFTYKNSHFSNNFDTKKKLFLEQMNGFGFMFPICDFFRCHTGSHDCRACLYAFKSHDLKGINFGNHSREYVTNDTRTQIHGFIDCLY